MNKVFLKLVIPNYNNLSYVKKCLDSVFSQEFKDFFVVFVDDISDDFSYECALAYQRMYPDKMKVVRVSEKTYAGGCRNIGIDWPVESEYIWFLDSDDWLASSKVFGRIKAAAKSSPDIIRCSYAEMCGLGDMHAVTLDCNMRNILRDGPGPMKTCVRSDLKARFVSNRAKNNDVVWFMRLLDSIDETKIACVKEPCSVYNRISSTSCQNNIETRLKPQCVEADRLIASDLLAEDFKKPDVARQGDLYIKKFSNMYKDPIKLDDMMRCSYVISIDDSQATRFNDIMRASGISVIPERLHGSRDSRYSGAMNCKRSHMMAVQSAKKNGWPYVMIFEDDAYPCIGCAGKMAAYLNAVPKDAKLVLFGWCTLRKGVQQFTAPFTPIATPTISGSQSYIVFQEGYDDFLKFHTDNPKNNADNTVFHRVAPSYIVNAPMFIQYSFAKSMNGHVGYIFQGDHPSPPSGFAKVEDLLSH